MGRSDAPGLRELPERKCCHCCNHFDEMYARCDRHDIDLRSDRPIDLVCDDWRCI
jgi:hypothetical protein